MTLASILSWVTHRSIDYWSRSVYGITIFVSTEAYTNSARYCATIPTDTHSCLPMCSVGDVSDLSPFLSCRLSSIQPSAAIHFRFTIINSNCNNLMWQHVRLLHNTVNAVYGMSSRVWVQSQCQADFVCQII